MVKYEQRKAIIGLKDKGGAKLSTSLTAIATVLRATAGDKSGFTSSTPTDLTRRSLSDWVSATRQVGCCPSRTPRAAY